MPKRQPKMPDLPDDWPVRGQLVNTTIAARLVGFAPGAVSNLCSRGKFDIPHRKINGAYMFDIEDIRDYLEKTKITPEVKR
jgi:hypothetical protein